MTAEEMIRRYIKAKWQPFAKVVVSAGKSGVHYPLRPDDDVPDDDDTNTIFLRIEE